MSDIYFLHPEILHHGFELRAGKIDVNCTPDDPAVAQLVDEDASDSGDGGDRGTLTVSTFRAS